LGRGQAYDRSSEYTAVVAWANKDSTKPRLTEAFYIRYIRVYRQYYTM
jgi:hypothetical protein